MCVLMYESSHCCLNVKDSVWMHRDVKKRTDIFSFFLRVLTNLTCAVSSVKALTWCVKNMCSRLIRVSRSLSFSLTLFLSLCVCASLAHGPAAIRAVHQFYGVPKFFPGISIERECGERAIWSLIGMRICQIPNKPVFLHALFTFYQRWGTLVTWLDSILTRVANLRTCDLLG